MCDQGFGDHVAILNQKLQCGRSGLIARTAPSGATESRPATVSLRFQGIDLMLPVGRIGQHRQYVFPCQLGEVVLNFLLGHPARQHGKNVVNRDAQPTYARPAAAFAGLQRDSVHFILQMDLRLRPIVPQLPFVARSEISSCQAGLGPVPTMTHE